MGNEKRCLEYLAGKPGSVSVAEVAGALGINAKDAADALTHLAGKRVILRLSRGRYASKTPTSSGDDVIALPNTGHPTPNTSSAPRILDDLVKQMLAESRPAPVMAPVDSDASSLIIVIGDLHYGEVVTMEGGTTYNDTIAAELITGLTPRILRLATDIKHETSVDEIVVVMGGDMIDGDAIFDGQWASITGAAFDQAKGIIDPLWSMLAALSDQFGVPVRVEAICGNHGRMAPKRSNAAPLNNWDLVVYEWLKRAAELLRDHGSNDRISVNYARTPGHVFTVKGHRVFIQHKGPVSLETAAGQKKLANWKARYRFDAAMFFHHHTLARADFAGCPIFRNGSPVGHNDFADELALYSAPRTWFMGANKKRFPTFQYDLHFERPDHERN